MKYAWLLQYWDGTVKLFSSEKKLNDFMNKEIPMNIFNPKTNTYWLTREQMASTEEFASYYKSRIF